VVCNDAFLQHDILGSEKMEIIDNPTDLVKEPKRQRTPPPSDSKVLPEIVDAGLTKVYRTLLTAAENGNITAGLKLLEWRRELSQEHASRAEAELAWRYRQLPIEVARLLDELDRGITDILERHERGLPLSPTEAMVVDAAKLIMEAKPDKYGRLRHRAFRRDRRKYGDPTWLSRFDAALAVAGQPLSDAAPKATEPYRCDEDGYEPPPHAPRDDE